MRKNAPREAGVQLTFRIPRAILAEIDRLIEKGYFRNRSDAVREAVRMLVAKYRELEARIELQVA